MTTMTQRKRRVLAKAMAHWSSRPKHLADPTFEPSDLELAVVIRIAARSVRRRIKRMAAEHELVARQERALEDMAEGARRLGLDYFD
jgi:hypothetical protein